jgi:hypothetical protein
MRSACAGVILGATPPTCSKLSTRVLNSCPSGSPAKRWRGGSPGALMPKEGLRSPSSWMRRLTLPWPADTTSSSSARSCAEAGASSSVATNSTGVSRRSR